MIMTRLKYDSGGFNKVLNTTNDEIVMLEYIVADMLWRELRGTNSTDKMWLHT